MKKQNEDLENNQDFNLGIKTGLMMRINSLTEKNKLMEKALIHAKHMLDTSHGYWVTDHTNPKGGDVLVGELDLHKQDFSKTIAMIEEVLKKVE